MSTINTTNLKNPSSGSNNIVLNADGTSTLTPSNIIKSGTAVASTSGTSIDFTSIPSWVKRVTVMLQGVSTSGTGGVRVQLGTSGGVVSTGYVGASDGQASSGGAATSYTNGLALGRDGIWVAASVMSGLAILTNITGNTWVGTWMGSSVAGLTVTGWGSTQIALSGVLTQVRVTSGNGTDTFDAGTVNILMEG